jgi:hypothetical protein
MPDNLDVRLWLRSILREEIEPLDKDGKAELAQVLKGPLMKPVWAALAERIEVMKDRAMSLELTKPEELDTLRAIQAETRGIIVVLETMWEMTNE